MERIIQKWSRPPHQSWRPECSFGTVTVLTKNTTAKPKEGTTRINTRILLSGPCVAKGSLNPYSRLSLAPWISQNLIPPWYSTCTCRQLLRTAQELPGSRHILHLQGFVTYAQSAPGADRRRRRRGSAASGYSDMSQGLYLSALRYIL